MLVFFTAGESHGRGVFALLDGLPAGLKVDRDLINNDLKRRQGGYGRVGRMSIEQDRVDVLSGIRGGVTLGSPILLAVWNKDFDNWKEYMDPWDTWEGMERYIPRPGHADLAGAARFRHKDLRNVLERSSARDTAARVAAGGLLRSLLKILDIEVYSWVSRVGGVGFSGGFNRRLRDNSSVYCPDIDATEAMEKEIDRAIKNGDTVGGEFKVKAEGIPAGIGSYTQWNQRLDALLAEYLMSIPGIKAVQIGKGVDSALIPGSKLHDEIVPGKPKKRQTNNAGGLEGGVTNGEAIEVTCTMKPIPTLMKGLASVDMRDEKKVKAEYERSDYCAVPAASVVGEAMVILAVCHALLDSFPLPNMDLLLDAFGSHRKYWEGL